MTADTMRGLEKAVLCASNGISALLTAQGVPEGIVEAHFSCRELCSTEISDCRGSGALNALLASGPIRVRPGDCLRGHTLASPFWRAFRALTLALNLELSWLLPCNLHLDYSGRRRLNASGRLLSLPPPHCQTKSPRRPSPPRPTRRSSHPRRSQRSRTTRCLHR